LACMKNIVIFQLISSGFPYPLKKLT
jgi:hypothetical protein